MEYCQQSNLVEKLKEATHIDVEVVYTSLTKFINGVEFYYDGKIWDTVGTGEEQTKLYKKPEDYKYLLEEPNNTSETSTWKLEDLRGKTVEVCVDKEGMVTLKDDYGYFYVVS